MAKKRRRVRRGATPANDKQSQVLAGEITAAPRRDPTSGVPRSAKTVDDLREEYSYVIRDLRLIFIIAVLMFALLIALNIGLRTL